MARILVKQKSSGQTGSLLEEEFDPILFERVEGEVPQGHSEPSTQTNGVGQITSSQLQKILLNPDIGSKSKTTVEKIFGIQQDEKTRISEEAKPTAAEEKRTRGIEDADRVITQLEDLFFGGEGIAGDLAKGRLGGILSAGKSAAGLNQPLKTYKSTREALRPTLARAAGDVGNLSLPEQEAAVKQFPTEFSTPEEAIAGFKAARQRFGLPERSLGEISGPSKDQAGLLLGERAGVGAGAALGGVGGFLVGGPVGAGLGAAAGGGAGGALGEILQDILGQQKEQPLEQLGGVAGQAGKAGINAFSLASILGLGKGAVAKSAAKKVAKAKTKKGILEEGLTTAAKGKKVRNTAIKTAKDAGKKVDGNLAYRSVKEWAKDAKRTASTSQKKAIDDFQISIRKTLKGKKLNPETAKSLWDQAGKGFSQAGKAGKTVEAGFNRSVREGVRLALEKVAPGFEKGTALIKKGLDKEKILKSVRASIERDLTKKELAKLDPFLTKLVREFKGPTKTAATFKALGFLGL